MKRPTQIGIGILGFQLATGIVAGATGGGVVATPNWLVYVGLAVLCPEEINALIQERFSKK